MKTHKSIKVLCAFIATLVLPINVCSAATFSDISDIQDINVTGSDIYLESDDVEQLFNVEDTSRIYSVYEIVDMYIESLEEDEQQEFLDAVDGNTVSVISGDGIIIIGYFSNTPLTNQIQTLSSTVTYNSKFTGTIKMQDSVVGDWYIGSVTYSATFGFDIYPSYWNIYGESDDVTYTTSPAAMHINISKYCYNSYSGSGTFYGNEISAKCTAYASVPMYDHESPLSIVLYPNSSYNYAYLGN